MTDDEQTDPPSTPEEIAVERERSRRSVTFILAVVAAAVVVIVGLAAWVIAVPYDVSAPLAGGVEVDCDTLPGPTGDAELADWKEAGERAEDDARADRRNTALVVGVGAFVVATAVSTWPSRRLTGERLGPLR